MNNKEVGKRIQRLRKQKGLTQQQMAEAIDISDNYLSNIETGKDTCSIGVLLSIANLLEASIDYLLGDNLAFNRINSRASHECRDRLIHEIDSLDENKCDYLLQQILLMKDYWPQ